ncbi:hypothetical protein [Bifidobacterium xylocopae]|nr:hypothetical protein [Bifidobacterium xylocopae]
MIDVQQRMTCMLLLVALAEYACDHGDDESLLFSYRQIMDSGYLLGG